MQSYDPDHPALRAAAAQDFEAFFAQESADRRELQYPPFGHLVEIEIRGKGKERVLAAGSAIKRTVARAADGLGVEILGPAPKPLARLKGLERWHLLLRCPSRKGLRQALGRALPEVRALRLPGLHVAVDVDPVQLL